MNKQELMDALTTLPDDVIILAQVVAGDGSAWSMMEPELSGVLEHFKWDKPVAAVTFRHPNLESLSPLKWKDD